VTLSPLPLSPDERAAFLAAAGRIGGADAERLVASLGAGVWPEEDGVTAGPPAEDEVRVLGVLELADLLVCLTGRARLRLLRGLTRYDRRRVRSIRSACPPEREEVSSLRDLLASPDLGNADPVLKAGLHRLARGQADREPVVVHARTAGFPPGWRGCLLAAHARLARLPMARDRAVAVRGDEDREV
jgi:hypothetical protein